MATPSQTRANIRNAQNCTGPKSEAGKAASSANSLRHGLTSTKVVLPHESAEEYETLRQQLVEDYQPANTIEAMFAENIAQNWWRLQRARRYEVILHVKADIDALDRLARYMNGIERAWSKSVAQLEKIQADRRKREEQAPPAESTTSEEIGFVSQTSETPVEHTDCQAPQHRPQPDSAPHARDGHAQ